MIPRFAPATGTTEVLAFLADLARPGDRLAGGAAAFEQAFAGYLGVEDAVFVPSGRLALWLVLQGLGYPPGSEVVLPGFTFFAVPAVVRLAGLTPVYADVDPATYTLTPRSVEAVLTPRTRAVVPTHLFGRTCDLDGLARVCAPRGVDLVEDCAQCFGAAVGGRKCGTLGRAATFTFGITKNFTTFGGAMLVARDAAVRARTRELTRGFAPTPRAALAKQAATALAMRVATGRFVFNATLAPLLRLSRADAADPVHRAFEEPARPISEAGLTSLSVRPGDAQGRAGLRQLRVLDARNAERRRLGGELLARLREAGVRGLPEGAPAGGDHIFMSFALLRPDRYAYAARLRRRGVDVSPGYMMDCAAEPSLGGRAGACPQSARVADEVLHVPLHPGLSGRDLGRIVEAVRHADAGR